jgi:hypothetical protein
MAEAGAIATEAEASVQQRKLQNRIRVTEVKHELLNISRTT